MSGETSHESVTISIEQLEEVVASLSEELKGKVNSHERPNNRAEAEGSQTVGNSYCPIFEFNTDHLNEAQIDRCRARLALIGYYRGQGDLHYQYNRVSDDIHDHKWRFLLSFLQRTELDINEFIRDMVPMVVKGLEYYPGLSSSYKDYIKKNSSDPYDSESLRGLVLSTLLDGCFVIELLRKFCGIPSIPIDDHLIFSRPWILPTLKTDLLVFYNQLPFFILQHLFDISTDKTPGEKVQGVSLANLVHHFFSSLMQGSKRPMNSETANNTSHLLHFFHSHFLPSPSHYLRASSPEQRWPTAELIPCATKLRTVGIKFKPVKEVENFLKIEFRNGVLTIPPIAFDDSTASILINCIMLERSHLYCSRHFSAYVIFMDSLINTARDVVLLSDNKIIDNYFGTDEEVAKFFNSLGKIATADIKNCHLSEQMVEVNKHYKSKWYEFQSSFMDTYFSSPWSFLSASAVLIALILTLIQTIYAILSYIGS